MSVSGTKEKPVWRAALPPLLLLCMAVASGQETDSIAAKRATQRPTSNVGLAIGQHIPEFRTLDQNGKPQDFNSIRGPNGAVLYFYRSADWCIYCRAQLEESEASRQALLKNGLGLVGVSYDSPEILKKFSDEKGIHFPLLSDPESKLIRDFQVLDDGVLPGTTGYGVPYHGFYVIDENGIVVAKLFDAEATLSHTTGVVVSKLFGSPLNTHERFVRHDRLTLNYYASANSLSPGDEIDLIVDVTLNDNIHVYAPPGKPYIPIDWKIADQSGITVQPVTYPSAQTLPVTGSPSETAAVYTGSFRLSRRVTIAPDAALALDSQGNVVLKGDLTFQACDDKVCYAPTTIKLVWKFAQARPSEHHPALKRD